MEEQYDVAIIGAGPGGYVAALRAAQAGLKTVCIDKRQTLGGTCLNVGCIPSKALLQSTELYDRVLHEGAQHGIQNGQTLSMDFSQLMSRKEGVVKSLTDGVAGLFKKREILFLQGEARFTSSTELEVEKGNETQKVKAKNFIIATGSDSIALPFLPFDEKYIVSSTGALALETIPKRLTIIGGGVIGVELATVYRRLGSEVKIIEMLDHICPAMDTSLSKQLLQVLKKQGLQFLLEAKVIKGEKQGESISLTIEHKGEQKQVESDVVLVAVGRRPYTAGLHLEKAGVKVTARGFIEVNHQFRTSQPHIFAIGDVIDGIMLAHRASEEGVIVADLIMGHYSSIDYMAVPNVIYTSPEAASVGLTEQEAKEAGLEIIIGQYFFRGNPRARCNNETEGFVKVIGEAKTKRLIGMHIIGSHASELIAEGMLAIQTSATLEDIGFAPNAHPTLSEAIKEAALQALGRPMHL